MHAEYIFVNYTHNVSYDFNSILKESKINIVFNNISSKYIYRW